MLEFKTKTPRSYLLALMEGEPLHASLLDLARREEIVSASISAMGVLRRAILDLPAPGGGRSAPMHLEGPFELSAFFGVLASEEGELRLEARASLSRLSDLGVQSIGGRLLHAEADYLELVVTELAGLGLRRDHDERLGLGRLRGKKRDDGGAEGDIGARKARAKASRAEPEASKKEAVSGWGEVIARSAAENVSAAVSAASARDEAPPAPAKEPRSFQEIAEIAERTSREAEAKKTSGEDALPKRGDYIEHKVFGVCRVDQMQGDGVMVIRLETGRRKQLKVDALEFLEPRTSGRRKIYPVRLKASR